MYGFQGFEQAWEKDNSMVSFKNVWNATKKQEDRILVAMTTSSRHDRPYVNRCPFSDTYLILPDFRELELLSTTGSFISIQLVWQFISFFKASGIEIGTLHVDYLLIFHLSQWICDTYHLKKEADRIPET